MQQVPYMEMIPGCCKNCGNVIGPTYLDMETIDDFHGRVYYCFPCVRQMANTMGFITPEQLKQIKEDHEEELEELRERVKHGNVVDWLSMHSVDISRFIAWLESEEVHLSPSGVRFSKSERDSRPAEQSDESRSDGVPISF